MSDTVTLLHDDEWTGRLSEYLDDELSSGDRLALEEHLRGCPACRTTLEQLRAVKVRAGGLGESLPGPHVWQGIAERIGAPGVTLDSGDELAARRVHDPHARAHAAEGVLPEKATRLLRERQVQRQEVGGGEDVLRRRRVLGPELAHALGRDERVVAHYAKPQAERAPGHLPADAAEPEHAQGLVRELDPAPA